MSISKFLTSSFLAPVFLLVPVLVIVGRRFGFSYPHPNLLLLNNLLFLVYLGFRFFNYLKRVPKEIRYTDKSVPSGAPFRISLDLAETRVRLINNGYMFDRSGRYGERKDIGFWGAILFHGALLTALAFGSYDYFTQFSGTLLKGLGEPTWLNRSDAYSELAHGFLFSLEDIPYKLQVTEQVEAGPDVPFGASRVELLSTDGTVREEGIIDRRTSLREGPLEIRMGGVVYDVWIIVLTTDNHILYTDWVRLYPLADRAEPYYYQGTFRRPQNEIEGEVYFDPSTKNFRVLVSHKMEKIPAVILDGQGPAHRVTEGSYVIKHEGFGRWSEIYIVKRRHKEVLFTSLALAGVGMLLRLLFRPKRVWVASSGTGTDVWFTERKLAGKISTTVHS